MTEEEKQSTEEKVTEEAQSTTTQGEIAPKTETAESKECTEKTKTEGETNLILSEVLY